MNKLHPILVGFLQALVVSIYVVLIGTFLTNIEKIFTEPPEILAFFIMLTLFVVSAAITGLAVFGYPVYLIYRGNKKRGLTILGMTILFLLLAPLTTLLVLALQ